MNSSRLLCLGYGFTARSFAARLKPKGWTIAATARNAEKAETIRKDGADAFLWAESGVDQSAFENVDALLVSTPPSDGRCPSFDAAADAIAKRSGDIKWIGYLSSNGVYGDHQGAWVDEDAPLLANNARGKARIRAEADWAGFGVSYSLPVVIFRLPGIYGPGKSALDKVRAGAARRIYKPDQVFNRMHVDDIAAALEASLSDPHAGGLFNLGDDEPAPPQDVIEYACALLGVEPPPLTPIEEANLSPITNRFYTDNKRIYNSRMKQTLGVALTYPTYREGLKAILDA